MSSTGRRKVVISSDEESNKTWLDDEKMETSVVPDSGDENESSSRLPTSNISSPEEIISGSNSFVSPRDASYASSGSSFASSTPRIRVKKRNEVGNANEALCKNSNKEHDRSRSFRETRYENSSMLSPISKKLTQKDDLTSKQKLRERVLKKNMLKDRNSPIFSSNTSEPLLNSALSPIFNFSKKSPSHVSVEDASVSSKHDSEDHNDDQIEDDEVFDSENSSNASSIQVVEDSNRIEQLKTEDSTHSILDSISEEPSDLYSEDSESDGSDQEEELPPRRKAVIYSSDEEMSKVSARGQENRRSESPYKRESGEKKAGNRARLIESSDEEAKEAVNKDETNREMPEKLEDSIICLSSDDEKEKRSDEKLVQVPAHLQKYMSEDLHCLEVKKQNMTNILKDVAKFNLKDGGAKLKDTLADVEQAIQYKTMMESDKKAFKKEPTPPSQDPFDPAVYSRLLAQDKKRLFGGKMTEGRWEAIQSATDKCLKGMHNAMTTMPDENAFMDAPNGLRLDLMHHQKKGLAWMVWRETQTPPGGILADDMGLGKTLSIISLVLHQKNERLKRKNEDNDEEDLRKRELAKKMGLTPSNTTLVVAPASVIYQWQSEIERRVNPDRLSVHVYHGPKNKRIDNPRRLARYDIVITTFNLVGTELMEKITTKNNDDDASSDNTEDEEDNHGDQAEVVKAKKTVKKVLNLDSVLAKVAFERVILDEAHQIKNRTTAASKGCCAIAAQNRWCLSGTPIHNNLWDLYSLIRFLRVAPFDDEKHWKEYIMASSQRCADRLNILTKSLLLRRTKAQTCSITQKPLVNLQPKEVTQHEIVLEGIEGDIYDMMFRATQQHVKALLDGVDNAQYERLYGQRRKKADASAKNPFNIQTRTDMDGNQGKFAAMTGMLVMLLRLRQACVHLHLTRNAVDMEAFEHLGGEDVTAEDILERTMAELTLGDKNKYGISGSSVTAEEAFEPTFLSSKLKKVVQIIDDVLELGDKLVVVSQWTSLLSLIETHLKARGTRYTIISGAVAPADRQDRVDDFNEVKGGAKIMLLSLTAGGVGLNLVGGNHLIMVDLHWNPALEAQACDRIYRMGQEKKVHIHRLVATGTIEQRVLALQEQKLKLANDVLEGAASKKMNKLTMQDLKYLFELDENKKPSVPQTRSGQASAEPVKKSL